jgi:hypothetical protein
METDIRSFVASCLHRCPSFTEGPFLMAVALLFQVFGLVPLLHGIMAGRKQPLNSDPHSIWKNKRIDYG